MTIREALQKAITRLQEAGIESASIDAKVLFAFLLGIETANLFLKYGEELNPEQSDQLDELLKQREKKRPVAYIIGKREFYSLDFIVNEHVLIPRPETEILVEHALKFLDGRKAATILDICTGSGNIPISICHEAGKQGEEISAYAFDISVKALEVAEQNKRKHGIGNLTLFRHDLFEERTNSPFLRQEFDLITANPPYVPMEEKTSGAIASDVLDYEPHIALFEEDNGCRAIFRIIEEAGVMLKRDGLLLIEISSDKQSEYITKRFEEKGYGEFLTSPVFIRDYAGINRILKAKRK